jgi:hypothetical protein
MSSTSPQADQHATTPPLPTPKQQRPFVKPVRDRTLPKEVYELQLLSCRRETQALAGQGPPNHFEQGRTRVGGRSRRSPHKKGKRTANNRLCHATKTHTQQTQTETEPRARTAIADPDCTLAVARALPSLLMKAAASNRRTKTHDTAEAAVSPSP